MKLVVFVGPSLDLSEARRHLDATFLPPVAQGELYRAARDKPDGIGIIDGYFDRVPAVWHKEILWAISQGVAVFGAASMGALRAAELASFGMIGVGDVFELFHRGELEDDDEVAISHLPREYGYRPITEAMVNVRATVAAAESQRIIRADTKERILVAGKALHFSDRRYEDILDAASKSGTPAAEIEAFRSWLPAGRVDRKRADAIGMLKTMSLVMSTGWRPDGNGFFFENTNAWQEVMQQIDESARSPRTGGQPGRPALPSE